MKYRKHENERETNQLSIPVSFHQKTEEENQNIHEQ